MGKPFTYDVVEDTGSNLTSDVSLLYKRLLARAIPEDTSPSGSPGS